MHGRVDMQEPQRDLDVGALVAQRGADPVTTEDFELLKVLGQGSFGKVIRTLSTSRVATVCVCMPLYTTAQVRVVRSTFYL